MAGNTYPTLEEIFGIPTDTLTSTTDARDEVLSNSPNMRSVSTGNARTQAGGESNTYPTLEEIFGIPTDTQPRRPAAPTFTPTDISPSLAPYTTERVAEGADVGHISAYARSVARGANSLRAMWNVIGDPDYDDIISAQIGIQSYEQSQRAVAYQQAHEADPSFTGWLKAVMKHPSGFFESLIETAPQIVASIAGSAAGGVAGAAAGSVASPVGTVVGGFWGARAGAFATEFALEYSGKILETVYEVGREKHGVPPDPQTDPAGHKAWLRMVMDDAELMAEAKEKGFKKGAVVASISALFPFAGGRVASRIGIREAQKAIAKDATREIAGETFGQAMRRIGFYTAQEAAAGGVGEALGSRAIGEEASWADIMAEALIEVPSSGAQTVSAFRLAKQREQQTADQAHMKEAQEQIAYVYKRIEQSAESPEQANEWFNDSISKLDSDQVTYLQENWKAHPEHSKLGPFEMSPVFTYYGGLAKKQAEAERQEEAKAYTSATKQAQDKEKKEASQKLTKLRQEAQKRQQEQEAATEQKNRTEAQRKKEQAWLSTATPEDRTAFEERRAKRERDVAAIDAEIEMASGNTAALRRVAKRYKVDVSDIKGKGAKAALIERIREGVMYRDITVPEAEDAVKATRPPEEIRAEGEALVENAGNNMARLRKIANRYDIDVSDIQSHEKNHMRNRILKVLRERTEGTAQEGLPLRPQAVGQPQEIAKPTPIAEAPQVEVQDDTQMQGRLQGDERVREEPGRPVQVEERGAEETEAGGVLQEQEEVTEPRTQLAPGDSYAQPAPTVEEPTETMEDMEGAPEDVSQEDTLETVEEAVEAEAASGVPATVQERAEDVARQWNESQYRKADEPTLTPEQVVAWSQGSGIPVIELYDSRKPTTISAREVRNQVLPTLGETEAEVQPEAAPQPVAQTPEEVAQPTGRPISEDAPVGREDEVITAVGNKYPVRYRLVDINTLITSHDDNGFVNENYDQRYQPRKRESGVQRLSIQQTEEHLDPKQMGESRLATTGAPIVSPSGSMTLTRNRGTIATRRALKAKSGRWQAYQQWLRENAQSFGFTPEQIDAVPNAYLVREIGESVSQDQYVTFAQEANESSETEMSTIERAKVYADRLSAEILALLAPNDEGNLNTLANREFVKRTLAEVIPANEHSAILTDKGQLNPLGLARIEAALIQRAYGSDVLTELVGNPDKNFIKNITKALAQAAPRVALLRAKIEMKYSGATARAITPLVDAALSINKLKEEHPADAVEFIENTVKTYSLTDPPERIRWMKHYHDNARSAKRITDLVNAYFNELVNAPDPNQVNLLDTVESAEKATDPNLTLFQGGPEAGAELPTDDVRAVSTVDEAVDAIAELYVIEPEKQDAAREILRAMIDSAVKREIVASPQAFVDSFIRGVRRGVTVDELNELSSRFAQRDSKGAITFDADGMAVFHALHSPDFSTFIHETAHFIRRNLMTADELAVAEQEYGVKNGVWTREADEAFAEGHETYWATGEAPNEALKSVFEKVKAWLADIYRNIMDSPLIHGLSDDMRRVFDAVYTGEGGGVAAETQGEQTLYQRKRTPASRYGTLPAKEGQERERNIFDDIYEQMSITPQQRPEGVGESVAQQPAPVDTKGYTQEELEIQAFTHEKAAKIIDDKTEALHLHEGMKRRLMAFMRDFQRIHVTGVHPLMMFDRILQFTMPNSTEEQRKAYALPTKTVQTLMRTHKAIAQQWIDGDPMFEYTTPDGTVKRIRSLKAIIAPVSGRSKDLNRLLMAHGAERYLEQGKPTGFEGEGDPRAIIDSIYAMYKDDVELNAVVNEIKEWHDARSEYLLQRVPEAKDMVEAFRQYAYYGPQYMSLDQFSLDMRSEQGGAVNAADIFETIKGRTEDAKIKEVVPQIVKQTQAFFMLAHRIEVAQSIKALHDVAGADGVIQRFGLEGKPVHEQLDRLVAEFRKATGLKGYFASDKAVKQMFAYLLPNVQLDTGGVVIKAFVEKSGEAKEGESRYELADFVVPQVFYDAFVVMSPPERNALLGFFAWVTAIRRWGTTVGRASFSMLWNPLRDFGSLVMQDTSGIGTGALAVLYMQQWFDGMKHEVTGSKRNLYGQVFDKLGLSPATRIHQDIDALIGIRNEIFEKEQTKARQRSLKLQRAGLKVLDIMNVSERASREAEIAAHVAMRSFPIERNADGTYKPIDVYHLTRDQEQWFADESSWVTSNFRDMSIVGGKMNMVVMFYNANIVGMRAFARAYKRNGVKAVMMGAFTRLLVPTLALWALNRDEDWYQDLPATDRALYWFIPFTDNTLVRIPKPFEWGAAFATTPEMLLNLAYTQDKEAFGETFDALIDMLSPLNYPQAAVPFIENWKNETLFFNLPIVPEAEEHMIPGEQVGPYTSQLAQALGKVAPNWISPRKIDAFLYAAIGPAIPEYIQDSFTILKIMGIRPTSRQLEKSDIPIAGRMFVRGGTAGVSAASIAQAYEDMARLEAIRNSSKYELTDEQEEYYDKLMAFRGAAKTLRNKIVESDNPGVIARLRGTIAKNARDLKAERPNMDEMLPISDARAMAKTLRRRADEAKGLILYNNLNRLRAQHPQMDTEALKRYARRDPQYKRVLALNRMATGYIEQGDYASASRVMQRIIEIKDAAVEAGVSR